ncbi:hypothetical protein GCM10023066_30500 [Nocardioides kongjuensis]
MAGGGANDVLHTAPAPHSGEPRVTAAGAAPPTVPPPGPIPVETGRRHTLDRVLRIDQATYDAIVEHAKRDHPVEACGMVAGPIGSDRPARLIEMVNAAGSPTFYEYDSTDLLHLYREMDDRDEEPVVIYHSHSATEAYPSVTDINLASEPGAHYVLVSTREHGNNPGPVEFRSYRIVDGAVTEEEVTIASSTEAAEESS